MVHKLITMLSYQKHIKNNMFFKYLLIIFYIIVPIHGFHLPNMCYKDHTCSATCQKFLQFEQIYHHDKIVCENGIDCPKTVIVKGKNITRNSSFEFISSETDEDLDFKLEIMWCEGNTFDVSETYVKVRRHVFDGVDLFLLLLSAFSFVLVSSCIPENDSLLFFMMMSQHKRKRYNRW